MKLLTALIFVLLTGCAATPTSIPDNVEGVFCTSVQTLTTTVTTVVASKSVGKLTSTADCKIDIKN